MMKKRVLGIFIATLFLISFSFVFAQTNSTTPNNPTTSTSSSTNLKISDAIQCLENRVKDRCASLSIEEKIFTVLGTGECLGELKEDASSEGCWPSGNCNVELTSKAIIALEENNQEVQDSVDWIVSRNKIPDQAGWNWYLQIDTEGTASCQVDDSTFTISENKEITGSSSCLSVSPSGYSLSISNSNGCLEKTYEISCDTSFTTSLLYEQGGIYYVSSEANTASGGGTTTSEKISSRCFSEDNGECNFEGNLWAALALTSQKYDIGPYLPYLETLAENSENEKYLPKAFLSLVSSGTTKTNYRNELLSSQISVGSDNYWQAIGGSGKYHDTALALFVTQPFPSKERTSAINWLEKTQGTDGCWDSGKIVSNGFLLYALSDKITPPVDEITCESSSGFCVLNSDCSESSGGVISGVSCPTSYQVCCDVEPVQETCADQNGQICKSGESCEGSNSLEIDDLSELGFGETCCVGSGSFCKEDSTEPVTEKTECESQYGSCKDSCSRGETELDYSCESGSSEVCCVLGGDSGNGGGLWWVWLLLILIFLLVLGIIFREKLRPLIFKIKSKFSKGPKGPPFPRKGIPPRGPPGTRQMPSAGRRVMPPTQQGIPRQAPPSRAQGDVDDVLKKLKEMGK